MRHRATSLLHPNTFAQAIRGGRALWAALSTPVHIQISVMAIGHGRFLSLCSRRFGQAVGARVGLMKHVTMARGRVSAWMILLLWIGRCEVDPATPIPDRT
jgi:nitrate reductase gamma subunit